MARSCDCSTCGATIRPRERDMSLGAAVRLHYWRKHRQVMMTGRSKSTRSRRK